MTCSLACLKPSAQQKPGVNCDLLLQLLPPSGAPVPPTAALLALLTRCVTPVSAAEGAGSQAEAPLAALIIKADLSAWCSFLIAAFSCCAARSAARLIRRKAESA